jgi:inosose dehydratase
MMNSRRNFISNAGKLVATAAVLPVTGLAAEKTTTESGSHSLFRLGMAGYTFVNFNIDKTLEMMKITDVHQLCIKDFHLPYKSNVEEISLFLKKLKDADVTGYAVGPISGEDISIDQTFEYARRVGVKLIIGIPRLEDFPAIEKNVKEHNIRYAVHNHGPDEKRYTNALSVYNLVKDLDPRIGLCFDIGHNMRFGNDPVGDMKKYAHRVFDIHLKNVTAPTKAGIACPLGRGIISIPAFVKVLHEVKYSGCCSLEYEKDMEAPLTGIAESVGYFKGVCDALN